MPVLNAPLPATIFSILDPQDSTVDGFVVFIIGVPLCIFCLVSFINGSYYDEDYEDYEGDEDETEYQYSSAEFGCGKRCVCGTMAADRKGAM